MIAVAAGTTHGLIRHHFGSKEDLWKAVIDSAIEQYVLQMSPLLSLETEIDSLQLLKIIVRNFVKVSARKPEIVKIVMNDCSKKGPRLNYIFERFMQLHRAIEPIFLKAQSQHQVKKFTNDSFFLFVLTTGLVPLALSEFTDKLCGGNILTEQGVSRHTELVIGTLFEE